MYTVTDHRPPLPPLLITELMEIGGGRFDGCRDRSRYQFGFRFEFVGGFETVNG